MKSEDFVTYDQALILKKLGFREPCLYFYDLNGAFCPNGINIGPFDYIEDYKNNLPVHINEGFRTENTLNPNFDICDAPFLWQVQKWLRKEKNLYLMFDMGQDRKHDGKFAWYVVNRNGFIISDLASEVIFDSPEEAISDGITECLKFLER